MNERLKQIMLESGTHKYISSECQHRIEKVAELIVRECAKVADEGLAEVTMKGPEWPSHYIKKHFGVEE